MCGSGVPAISTALHSNSRAKLAAGDVGDLLAPSCRTAAGAQGRRWSRCARRWPRRSAPACASRGELAGDQRDQEQHDDRATSFGLAMRKVWAAAVKKKLKASAEATAAKSAGPRP